MEESQMGFISYWEYIFSSFLSSKSIIFPQQTFRTVHKWSWTLKHFQNETGRKWLQHYTCSTCLLSDLPIHPATFMTSCSWFYLSWNICYHSAPPLCGIRASGYTDSSNDPLCSTCLMQRQLDFMSVLGSFSSWPKRFLSSDRAFRLLIECLARK